MYGYVVLPKAGIPKPPKPMLQPAKLEGRVLSVPIINAVPVQYPFYNLCRPRLLEAEPDNFTSIAHACAMEWLKDPGNQGAPTTIAELFV